MINRGRQHRDTARRTPVQSGEESTLILTVLKTANALPGGVALFKHDCELLQHTVSDYLLPLVELIDLGDRLLLVRRDTGAVTLRELLQQHGALPPGVALAVAEGVACALRDIHYRNTVYKTLCPETIYVDRDLWRVQLGTPLLPFAPDNPPYTSACAYLSPEQIQRALYTRQYRTDFYSLGIVLYEMLTGVPPVSTDSVASALRGHEQGAPLAAVESAELPGCVRSILRLLLAPDAEYRYQSAEGVLYDLRLCAQLPDDVGFRAGTHDRSAGYRYPDTLYGRDEELRLLCEAGRRVAGQGRAEVVLLAGAAGMGKTALIEQWKQTGMACARCSHIDMQQCALPHDEAELRALLGMSSAEPVVADGTVEESLLVVLDHLHCVSAQSLAALADCLRDTAQRPVLLCATTESVAESVPLIEAVEAAGIAVQVLTPAPLHLSHIRQMITETFGVLPDDWRLSELVLHRTAGNPGAVRAVLDELVEAHVLRFSFGRWQYDIHRLREVQAARTPADVLAAVGSALPGRVVEQLSAALAVDGIVGQATVRELKKEIRTYRKQARRNKEFVGNVHNFAVKIARSMPELLFLVDISQWKELYANHDLFDALGYMPDHENTHRSVVDLLHPDDRDIVDTGLQQLGNAADRDIVSVELRLRAADGSWQWFSVWSAVFNRTADGRVRCVFGMARNSTPRKEAQAALAESERRLSTIYNSVSDAIVLIAVEETGNGVWRYVIATVNEAFLGLTGMEERALIGREFRDVFGELLSARFLRYCARALATRRVLYYEQELELPHGQRTFETTLTPIIDRNGRCTHILVSGHDITRRMRAEERILAKYRENRQLMKELDAQKNALMNAIVETQEEERRRIALDLHDGLAQTLSIAKLNFSSFEMEASGISSEQQQILHTSIDLLDSALRELSLISYNLMPNTLHSFGLVPALEDMFHMINRVSDVRLSFHTHDYRRLAHRTEILLYRIIQELVSNAYRHSGASEISVQLVMHHRRLVVVVDDNGKGFEVSGVMNEGYERLGLKSVETRVKFLSGSISVDSHANSGTVIAIEIPLTSASFADDAV